MSDDTTPLDGEMTDPATGDDEPLGEAGKKALDAERQRARELEAETKKMKALLSKYEADIQEGRAAKERLQQIENAGKSETEKLQAALNQSEQTARKATIRAMKLDALASKSLPRDWVEFLPDLDDEVDMIQAVDKLTELMGKTGGASSRPKSTLTNPLGDEDPAASQERIIAAMTGRTL